MAGEDSIRARREDDEVRTGRRRRLLTGAACAVVLGLGLAGCSEPQSDEGSLAALVPEDVAEVGAVLVAADLANAPAGFTSPTEFEGVAGAAVQAGEFTGFDVQLVEDAADLLGLRVEWFALPFDDVLPAVTNERATFAASAITVTPQRSQDVDFITYLETGTQWVTSSANELGVYPNSACGARVGVQAGTIQVDDLAARSAQCEADGQDPITVLDYPRQDDVSAALLEGEVDAFLADLPAAEWAVRQGGGPIGAASTTTSTELAFAGGSYDEQPYGLAFRPEDTALAQAFATALQQLAADGTYQEILEFWSVDAGALPEGDIQVVD
jgi:polar amino acid transport system substrate-binding protein